MTEEINIKNQNQQELADVIENRKPILDLSPAEISYLEQTRKECDTEKVQKDKVLQYAFLVVGGTSIYGLTNLDQKTIVNAWTSIIISLAILVIIIGLMNWRRQKFRAQGYRMVVLWGLIKSGTRKGCNWIGIEEIIVNGLKKNVHGRDDLLFVIGLTLPIEALIIFHSYTIIFNHKEWFAIIPSIISLILVAWAIRKHSKPLYKEFGIGNIIEQIEENLCH